MVIAIGLASSLLCAMDLDSTMSNDIKIRYGKLAVTEGELDPPGDQGCQQFKNSVKGICREFGAQLAKSLWEPHNREREKANKEFDFAKTEARKQISPSYGQEVELSMREKSAHERYRLGHIAQYREQVREWEKRFPNLDSSLLAVAPVKSVPKLAFLICLCLLAESVLNAKLLAHDADGGPLEGALTAIAVSFVNVGILGLAMGLFSKWIWSRQSRIYKASYAVGVAAVACAVAFNLWIMYTRGQQDGGSQAQLLNVVLLGIGGVAWVIGFIKGITHLDGYAGYRKDHLALNGEKKAYGDMVLAPLNDAMMRNKETQERAQEAIASLQRVIAEWDSNSPAKLAEVQMSAKGALEHYYGIYCRHHVDPDPSLKISKETWGQVEIQSDWEKAINALRARISTLLKELADLLAELEAKMMEWGTMKGNWIAVIHANIAQATGDL